MDTVEAKLSAGVVGNAAVSMGILPALQHISSRYSHKISDRLLGNHVKL